MDQDKLVKGNQKMKKNLSGQQSQNYKSYLGQNGFCYNPQKSDYYSATYSFKKNGIEIDVNIGTSRFGSSVQIYYKNTVTGEYKSISSYSVCLTKFSSFKEVIESLIK